MTFALERNCQIITFFSGLTEICFMSAPVGECNYCCARNDTLDIQYKLFTRSNSSFQVLPPGDVAALSASSYNMLNPTVIYLMGFTEAVTGPATTAVKNAYMALGNYNFIAVDWARLIAFPWYITALRNTRYMGSRLANFIEFLLGAGTRAQSIHVIGFSLGAEAAGFAGKILRGRGVILARITGLDPAYPGYNPTDNNAHLARGDASFVDVVHTNPGVYGFPLPIGDVDFYPNHGQWLQPGCWIFDIVRNRDLLYACSHNRAWRLYAESVVNPRGFPATLCRTWQSPATACHFSIDGYMGFAARLPMRGKMYLRTNSVPPFARNGP